MDEDLVVIAVAAKPRGLRGEIAADILTDFPERFDGLVDVIGEWPDGKSRPLKLEKSWMQKGRVVLKFEGFDTPEAADELRGVKICIPEADAVELEDGEFYDWQLEGCNVETADGVEVGTVKELMRTGGTEIIVVTGKDKEYLIPFAESICLEVDIGAKKIVIDPPEGLLDF